VASFLATSSILNDPTKNAFSIGVGILTAGATILQSISSSFGFQSRSDNFQKAADSYDNLLTKLEFEIYNPNEDFNEFCNDLEMAILDIKNNCKYLPPLFIYNIWEQNKDKYLCEFIKISENASVDTNSINTSSSVENGKINTDPLDHIKEMSTSKTDNSDIIIDMSGAKDV
jgi:hypothetical protein